MKMIVAAIAAIVAATPAVAAPVLNAANGHYYEFIGNTVSFDTALSNAAASSYLGQQGYLATVTSAAEQDFIYASVTTASIWLGGSDRAVEGTWVWLTGPEAGTVFWNGGSGGSSPTYANWSGGEPNNSADEDYLWGNWSGSTWNDISSTSIGYLVEYGDLASAVPEPASWMMMIGGFGLIGAAMRQRKTVRAVSLA